MKVVHTADIHLKIPQDERWYALEEIVKVAEEEKAELLVISGDLFDKDVDAERLRPALRKVFSKTNFLTVVIPGNHDRGSYTEGLYFGENFYIIRDLRQPLEYKDVRIWGFPFEPIGAEEVFYKLYELKGHIKKDKKNLLLIHCELLNMVSSKEGYGDEVDRGYMPVKLSYFKQLDFDYVLAGHFHSRFDVLEFKEKGFFVYPGSPVSITFLRGYHV